MSVKNTGFRKPLVIAAIAVTLGLGSSFPALSKQGGGGGMGGGSGMGSGAQDRDRVRDPDQMRDQLRDMDRIRDRLHQNPGSAERRELMNQYRQRIEAGMRGMRAQQGPGPNADDAARYRYMQQNQEQMQQMMRHMWEYQQLQGQ